jgi:mRNA-degrading endonuclease RelE of RelBE toxin-antitoxin system
MAKALLSREAQDDFSELPMIIRAWALEFFALLAANWPAVSGVKRLKGDLHGTWSKRHGAWRMLFREVGATLLITRIDHRRKVYDS